MTHRLTSRLFAASLLASVFVFGASAAALADTSASEGVRGDRVAGEAFATRSAVVAPTAAAATAHPLATQVALDVMKRGGTAVDAAIAANAMLGLVEPVGCGIGGDLYALVWDPKTEKLYGLNASGRSPKGLSLATARAEAASKGKDGLLPPFGAVTVSVPGAVSGWYALHRRFGKTPMPELLAPAISYAEAGAPIPQTIAYYWGRNRDRLERAHKEGMLQEVENARATFWPNGIAPVEGSLFRNPDLAKTYRLIATGGEAAFYDGPVAWAIDRYMRRIGGWLRAEDLAAHRADWVEPFCVPYRNTRVCGLGQNTQGVTTLQILGMLEGFDLKAAGLHTSLGLHLMAEATRLAFADRSRAFFDPDFTIQAQGLLLDPAYLAARRALIRQDAVMATPAPGAAAMEQGAAPDGLAVTSSLNAKLSQGDTTYLTVADGSGMMVSLIQSNFRGMGSGLVPDELGFMLQNRGELFALDSAHPNVFAPGKRPFQTIIPGFAFKDGAPWLSFGVMGGDMQPQGQAQIIINLIDHGLGLQAAGDAARYRFGGSAEPTGEAADGQGTLHLESRIPADVVAALKALGHRIGGSDGSFGGYQAIMRDPVNKTWQAATEMRKDGAADGF
jgi:gamma-glutamyltranspeptidase/glutathione hydrolase